MKARLLNLLGASLCLSGGIIKAAELPGNLVDPTRPLDYIAAPLDVIRTDLVLNSVVITGTTRFAVINGERVVEKQVINGSEVVSIQPGKVILRQGNRNQELKVHRSSIKQ